MSKLRTKDMVEILELPSAEEVREYQSGKRQCLIKMIWSNAKEGYVGLTIKKDDVPENLANELRKLGYDIYYFNDYVNIKWGKDEE